MSACQSLGTPVIQLDIDMEVHTDDSSGQNFDVGSVASAPTFPFEWPYFAGRAVEWKIQTHVNGFSIDVKNVSGHEMNVAWNQARWRSSLQEQWSEFLVHGQWVGRLNDRKREVSTDMETPFVPESWTLQPGQEEYFSFRAAIGEGKGNPEGLLFGISKEEVVAGAFHDAIDRWVEVEIPLITSDNRANYIVRLVLSDAASWTSYY